MANYIDKDLFLQDIKMRYCNNCARPNEIKCRACHVDDMLGEIEDSPTADVEGVKWIDVNEKLPEKEGKYIVYTESITGYKPLEYNVFIADYVFDDFVFKGWENNRVTHWQPLPEPPNGAKMDGGKE